MDRVVEEAFKHTSNRVANSSNDQPNGHANSHSTVNGSSSSSDVLRGALRVGFDFIVNIQPRYVAEQLARYVDRKLRGEQGVSEPEAELSLSRAMLVFKFLAEKDIFEAFYKKLLAKRLLLGMCFVALIVLLIPSDSSLLFIAFLYLYLYFLFVLQRNRPRMTWNAVCCRN